ncbi:MAG: hypothetical protein J1F16_10215 [Muribaculaceae bacterium]|nr:hypothetical protein [Muribaculaceae bacterium]
MKLLFVDNSLKELMIFRGDVINHFLNLGYEVNVIAPDNLENPEKLYPFFKKINYFPVKLDNVGNNPIHDLSYTFKLFKLYKNIKPDYIFHYTIKPNIYGTLSAKALKIKSCSMIAGLGSCFSNNGIGDRIARFLYRLSLKYSDKVLVLNQSNYTFLIENKYLSSDKIILLEGGEGVNLDKFN